MSTTEKTPAVATQDLPADEGIIASQAIEIEELRGRLAAAEGESLEKDEEITRTREELRLANIELRKSEARLEAGRLWEIADKMNRMLAKNKGSIIVLCDGFRTTVATYFCVAENDGHPTLHYMDEGSPYLPPQAIINLASATFRFAMPGENIRFKETKNADAQT